MLLSMRQALFLMIFASFEHEKLDGFDFCQMMIIFEPFRAFAGAKITQLDQK